MNKLSPYRNGEKFTFKKELIPLFYAMVDRQEIKKVVFVDPHRRINNGNDVTMENFVVDGYLSRVQGIKGDYDDYVETNILKSTSGRDHKYFYMGWVKSFELYKYMEMPDGKLIKMEEPYVSC